MEKAGPAPISSEPVDFVTYLKSNPTSATGSRTQATEE